MTERREIKDIEITTPAGKFILGQTVLIEQTALLPSGAASVKTCRRKRTSSLKKNTMFLLAGLFVTGCAAIVIHDLQEANNVNSMLKQPGNNCINFTPMQMLEIDARKIFGSDRYVLEKAIVSHCRFG